MTLSKEMVLRKLNEVVRGWVGNFNYENCSKDLSFLKRFLEQRLRIYLRRKHQVKSLGYEAYPDIELYEILGPYRILTTAPWKKTAKAAGGR